jgi:flavin-dependent trigonelline monooxygenase, reductase component
MAVELEKLRLLEQVLGSQGAAMSEPWVDVIDGDSRAFRNSLGAFVTGITVVATRAPDRQPRAVTANSFVSVSLTPPLILVCVAKTSASVDIFAQASSFSVSVLGDWQREACRAYASRDPLVKAAATARLSGLDTPYVGGSLAVIICEREQVVDAGDHIILLGKVQRFQSIPGQPLGYFRGGYVWVAPPLREIELDLVSAF